MGRRVSRSRRSTSTKSAARKEKVITTLSGGLKQLAKRRKVNVIHAKGVFENSTTLRLEGDDPSIPAERTLTFDHCILATGSTPAMPPAFNIGSDRVMDSTGALDLVDLPKTLLVIGGGYIGLEMGTVYANLGSQGERRRAAGRPAAWRRSRSGQAAAQAAQQAVRRADLSEHQGRLARPARASKVEVAFEGPGKFGTERYDRVLVSVGRRPNSRGFGLENTQVEIDAEGLRRRRQAAAHGRSAHPGDRRRGRRADAGPQGHARRPHRRRGAARQAGGVRQAGDSRRRVHRSRNRLGRPDRRAGQEGRPQVEVGHLSLGRQRPGALPSAAPKG